MNINDYPDGFVDTVLAVAVPFVKNEEGFRAHAYPDPASGGAPWTIGWGSTGNDIGQDTAWTVEECEERLHDDLMTFAGNVIKYTLVRLNVNECAALTSFSYNEGLGAYRSSTLKRLLESERYSLEEVARQFRRWVYAGGKKMPGLVARRERERVLFLKQGV